MSLRALPRIYRLPNGSFFLFGLRGVGKSTWIRSQLPDAHRFDLLDEGLYQELLADPAPFAGDLRRLDPGGWVVVDEVQRLPGLLNEVHRSIEERGLRFALLGSSARKLRAAGVNLLGGRALWREMFPLTPEELGEDFDLERTLQVGALPLVLDSDSPHETLRAYVQLYLREEIKGEALVRNLPGFARFLPVAGLFHGQLVNVSGIARDAGVARTTVEGYLGVLEDTLLVRRLPAYEARLRVRERKHPKLYWVDPGVARAAKGAHGPVAQEEAGASARGLGPHPAAHLHGRARARRGDRLLGAGGIQGSSRSTSCCAAAPTSARSRSSRTRRVQPGHLPACARSPTCRGCGGGSWSIAEFDPTKTEDGIDAWPVETLLEALAEDRLWS